MRGQRAPAHPPATLCLPFHCSRACLACRRLRAGLQVVRHPCKLSSTGLHVSRLPPAAGSQLALEATAATLVRQVQVQERGGKQAYHFTRLAKDCETIAQGIGLPSLAGGVIGGAAAAWLAGECIEGAPASFRGPCNCPSVFGPAVL